MSSEKRLIDANELESRLVRESEFRKSIMNYFGALVIDEIIADDLANSPTVDAVEVVHGEWTMCLDEDDVEYIECPLCGEGFYDGDNDTFDKPYNYCPNCGAKMDLEV